jgi:enolase-phosphatase E1
VDIEGTTTSISFVHDKLFGIVRTQLASFLDSEWIRPDVQESISLLRQQVTTNQPISIIST